MTNIKSGKVYLDDSQGTLEEKVKYHAGVYKSTTGMLPNIMLLSPQILKESVEISGIKLVPDKSVNIGVFYVGLERENKNELS